jgi:uncharacterized protein
MINENDLKYLKRAGCSNSVIEHSIAVAEKALKIADSVSFAVEHELIKKGAVNHDIGRAKTHGLEHFLVGAEIAAELGIDEDVVRIIERHIGAGIPMEEAVVLGLPPKDYMPETPEEIIVSYADNLTRHITHITIDESMDRFRSWLGDGHPMLERLIEMHNKVSSWMGAPRPLING